MTDNEYIELILTSLYKRLDRVGLCIRKDILKPNDCDVDRDEMFRIVRIVEATGLVKSNDQDFCGGIDLGLRLKDEGINILKEHGSYSSYLNYLRRENERQNKRTKREFIINVSAIIVGVIGLGWGILKDIQSSKDEAKIEKLNDSLKKDQIIIDSLKSLTPSDTVARHKID
jgi:hypothetical protein